MSVIRHLRLHGRGGEGVKLAARVVSRAAFLAGRTVQDSPLYGAERRGAPVVAFVRLGDGQIHERGYIVTPDAVVLLDASLLAHPEAAVIDGLDAASVLLANSAHSADELRRHYDIPARVVTLDISSIALDLLGHHLLSAPMAGFVIKALGIAPWERLAEAIRIELQAIGLARELVEQNLRATRRAFDESPTAEWSERAPAATAAGTALFVVPRLPARVSAPSMTVEATSALRHTEGWRVYRPDIELARCTRCFLCFALCPEGAIRLDEENYPVVDYEHCKGCLVCVSECPPKAIHEIREETA